MQWFKANIATVVTWLLLALAAASTVGAHQQDVATVKKDVVKVESRVDDNEDAIGRLDGDVRQLKDKQGEIVVEVKGFRGAISDLHRVVARLETLVEVLKKEKE